MHIPYRRLLRGDSYTHPKSLHTPQPSRLTSTPRACCIPHTDVTPRSVAPSTVRPGPHRLTPAFPPGAETALLTVIGFSAPRSGGAGMCRATAPTLWLSACAVPHSDFALHPAGTFGKPQAAPRGHTPQWTEAGTFSPHAANVRCVQRHPRPPPGRKRMLHPGGSPITSPAPPKASG